MKIDWEGFQEISPQDQKKILQWFHELQEDDAMCQQELRQMICGIDLMENRIKDLQEQLSSCQKDLAEKALLENTIEDLQEQLSSCQKDLAEKALLENTIEDLQEQLSGCQKGLEDARGLLDQKESDLKRLEGENKTLQAELDQFLELLME